MTARAEVSRNGSSTVPFERTPPHDLAAEQCVLGGMLLSRSAIDDVVDVIGPADHYRPAHQIVHEAVIALYGDGEPVDAVTVANELTKRGEIARVGGAPYLHTLIACVPTAANAGYYARIVRARAILRRQIKVCTRGVQKGYEGQVDDAEELVATTIGDLEALLAEHSPADAIEPMDILVRRALEDLDRHMVEAPGLKTGFADLDNILAGGLRPGQLISVGARPALGKTTFALDLARSMSVKRGHVGQLHALEMPRDDLILAMLAAEAHVPSHALRTHDLDDEIWQKIALVTGRMMHAPLFVDDSTDLTVPRIEARYGQLTRSGYRPEYIIVDYLQLLRGTTVSGRRPENRQQEVSEMTRGLKLLAKKLALPVVICAQLNRGPETRADKRPALADFRESGSAEQDSDVVILLHREDAYEPETPRAGEADFIVAKNRNGPTGTITVAFQGHYRRFVDMARI